MNKEVLALKFMCNMERFATQIYMSQCRAFSGSNVVEKLKKASVNERSHVDSLRKSLVEHNSSPSSLGLLFRLMGRIVGFKTSLLGRSVVLKTDTWIEKRAIKDYGLFIRKLDFNSKTESMLKKIIKDEEKHVKTWQDSARVLKVKSKKRN